MYVKVTKDIYLCTDKTIIIILVLCTQGKSLQTTRSHDLARGEEELASFLSAMGPKKVRLRPFLRRSTAGEPRE